MDETKLLNKLENIEKLLKLSKKVLSFDEACFYMEISRSYMYKLTSTRSIPHYKPAGKRLFFDREELEQWLLSNRVTTKEEIDQQATEYVVNNKFRF